MDLLLGTKQVEIARVPTTVPARTSRKAQGGINPGRKGSLALVPELMV